MLSCATNLGIAGPGVIKLQEHTIGVSKAQLEEIVQALLDEQSLLVEALGKIQDDTSSEHVVVHNRLRNVGHSKESLQVG